MASIQESTQACMDDLSALRSALVQDDFAVVNQLRDKHQQRLQNELHGIASSFNSLVDDPIAKVLLAPLTATMSRKIRSSKGWQTVDLKTVESIVQYNKHMGGVDRHDHLRSNYTIQRPGHRWWKYFVWFLMDVALVNAYILYKTLKDKKISHTNNFVSL
ncbi:PiggyBac transposable element-derived protein 4-like [Elysia marginata]|uniref:PiggyBac transposable element-derived protein 4-like n=1 Tax=Elysia marginata TaxID=1093978 RepID=A0AAV4GPD5_9GAST|nr:PiggyBac transposable element-derived protein 4-like [Elysia marginata]